MYATLKEWNPQSNPPYLTLCRRKRGGTKNFWLNIFFRLKFFGPTCFSDPKFFLDQNFFGHNFFQIFFGHTIFFNYFWDTKLFGHNIFLSKNFFGSKNFSGPKNILEQQNRIFFGLKTFSEPNFFLTQKDLVWFYGINLPNQNRLNQRLFKLNTLDIILVLLSLMKRQIL